MESFLPSEIGRLIYGYLSECDQELANMFLNSSNVMEECRLSKKKSRRFSAKVQGLSLVDILDQYSILCSLISKNVNNTESVHRNVLSLLQNLLYSKVCERDESLADGIQKQDFNISIQGPLEHRPQSISEPVVDNVPENTNTVVPEAETSASHVEKMDVSSNSAVHESQNVSKAVDQSIQTEPIEQICLSDSDNETVIENSNNKDPQVLEERSPIDLTSPRPIHSIFDSPKAKDTVSCENTNAILNKISPDVSSKSKAKIEKTKTPAPKTKSKPNNIKSESKLQEVPNEMITPPENVKNSRIRDTSVFSNLNCRRESSLTPLKPNSVFGKDREKPILNNSLTDQNKSTTQPEKNIVKTELAPKPVRNNVSKQAERRDSSRTAPQIIPPHQEKPPPSKANSKLTPVPRKSHTKSSGNQPKDISPQCSKRLLLDAPPNSQLKKHLLGDSVVGSKKKPEPWDAFLRRQLASEEADSAPKELPQKTPKKCKRELKSVEPPAKKRKLDEPQNTTNVTRTIIKSHPDDEKSENRQNEINVEYSPSNHRNNQQKHQKAKHDDGDHRMNKREPKRSSEIQRHSRSNLSKIETPKSRDPPINRPKGGNLLEIQNHPNQSSMKQSSRTERPEPENCNESATVNDTVVLPLQLVPSSMDIINNIMRTAAENAAIKCNLVNPEINEQDTDSSDQIPKITLDTEDILIYEANINVDTPSC